MLAAAANALAGLADVTAPGAGVLPPVTSLRAVSAAVAEAVARAAWPRGCPRSRWTAWPGGSARPCGAGLPRGGGHLGRCRGRCTPCRCRTATGRPTCGSTRRSLAAGPVPGAEPLPGRYVAPGLVDAHAHPAVAPGRPPANPRRTLDELAAWAAAGVAWSATPGPGRVRAGPGPGPGRRGCRPPGGSSSRRALLPGAAPEEVPEERLTELALAELARGSRWVKVIADFPPVTGGKPSGPPLRPSPRRPSRR